EPSGDVVAKPVAPIVAMQAILRLARHGLEPAFIGTKSEIVAAEAHGKFGAFVRRGRRAGRAPRSDFAPAVTVGAIEPIVQAVFEPVHPMLLIALMEASKQRFAPIGLAIAIGIFRV